MLGNLFQKFKDSLRRNTPTFQKVLGKIGTLFASKLDATTLDQLEESLYAADFGVETTTEILDEIRRAHHHNKDLRGQDAAHIGAATLTRILANAEGRHTPDPAHNPEVIALIGVNGAGKTTTAAKLAWRLQQNGHKVILGACDTFRAAANAQIQTWAQRLNIEIVTSQHGADAAAVAYDTLHAARARHHNIAILDTAGRLHTKTHLLEELKKIGRVVQKLDPSAPHHRWLVVDGSLGSNSIDQARAFHASFGLTGLIITKLDGTSRGGALVGIHRALQIPIHYVGLGEQPDDLQPFSTQAYIEALFGETTTP
ncbi:MAG: signal recognition particle-docking protein FtsY [Puniceicoccales bacterium]|jgi:fused signal recognition particle receptor|nr:signal recognition particle-docking protein FtsY [Puniceicoccales bacterium]